MFHHDVLLFFFALQTNLPNKIVQPACHETILQDAAVDAFYRMHLEGRDMASAAEAVLDIYKDAGCGGNLIKPWRAGSWVNCFHGWEKMIKEIVYIYIYIAASFGESLPKWWRS